MKLSKSKRLLPVACDHDKTTLLLVHIATAFKFLPFPKTATTTKLDYNLELKITCRFFGVELTCTFTSVVLLVTVVHCPCRVVYQLLLVVFLVVVTFDYTDMCCRCCSYWWS